MSESLNGQVAIVTGAGRGAGRAIALALAGAGADLVLTARTAKELSAVAGEVEALGHRCLVVSADVGNAKQVQTMAEQAQHTFGRIDILVNNAGVGHSAPVEKMTLEDWNRVIATNLTGVFLCSKAVLPAMKSQGRGHIIIISSGAGKQGYPNLSAYSASKFGVIGFAQALSGEVMDDHIKVNVITPGTIDTGFSSRPRPERLKSGPVRMLRPEDVAEAVLYLVRQPPSAWTAEMSLWPFQIVTE